MPGNRKLQRTTQATRKAFEIEVAARHKVVTIEILGKRVKFLNLLIALITCSFLASAPSGLLQFSSHAGGNCVCQNGRPATVACKQRWRQNCISCNLGYRITRHIVENQRDTSHFWTVANCLEVPRFGFGHGFEQKGSRSELPSGLEVTLQQQQSTMKRPTGSSDQILKFRVRELQGNVGQQEKQIKDISALTAKWGAFVPERAPERNAGSLLVQKSDIDKKKCPENFAHAFDESRGRLEIKDSAMLNEHLVEHFGACAGNWPGLESVVLAASWLPPHGIERFFHIIQETHRINILEIRGAHADKRLVDSFSGVFPGLQKLIVGEEAFADSDLEARFLMNLDPHPSLRALSLEDHCIGVKSRNAIGHMLSSNRIQNLSLSNTSLFKSTDVEFLKLGTSLKLLDCSNNAVDYPWEVKKLASIVEELPQLIALNISHMGISILDAFEILPPLVGASALESLDLSGLLLMTENIYLGTIFAGMPHLTELFIDGLHAWATNRHVVILPLRTCPCKLRLKIISTIQKVFLTRSNPSITSLSFAWNHISGHDFAAFAGVIADAAPSLRALDISDNCVDGVAVVDFLRKLPRTFPLRSLELGGNCISEKKHFDVNDAAAHLPALRIYGLDRQDETICTR